MTFLLGCDFSSAPTRKKPIIVAVGDCKNGRVQLTRLERFDTLADFSARLAEPGHWLGAFDFPFGLPRELVEHLGWPDSWPALMAHYAGLSRADLRQIFSAFCAARPAGSKFAHRTTDRLAGSSPSMKWVNPPVAYMLHAGVPCLLAAGVEIAGLKAGDKSRTALEAYPGLLARELIGSRPYKKDARSKQTPERLIARKDLITGLEMGQTRLGLRLKLTHAQRDSLVDDGSGDTLDAVLCLVQAAWAQARHAQGAACYGLPADMDALEGWIVSA